jgi:hypothetical protein
MMQQAPQQRPTYNLLHPYAAVLCAALVQVRARVLQVFNSTCNLVEAHGF